MTTTTEGNTMTTTASSPTDFTAPLPPLVLATDFSVATERTNGEPWCVLKVRKFTGDGPDAAQITDPFLHGRIFADNIIDGREVRCVEHARRAAWSMGYLKKAQR